MDQLSRMTPGGLFILFFSLILASSPEILTKIIDITKEISELLDTQLGPVVISINFLFLILLVSLIAAISFIIEKIWDFLFYFILKGYDRKEYKLIKDELMNQLPKDSKYLDDIKKMKVQPIYGQFLHSYANQTFVEWLTRRWQTYHTSANYSIGIILAIILSSTIIWLNFNFSNNSYFLIFTGIIFTLILLYIGNKRKNELLMSEYLFCISIIDPDVADIFDQISHTIIRRNKVLNDKIYPSKNRLQTKLSQYLHKSE